MIGKCAIGTWLLVAAGLGAQASAVSVSVPTFNSVVEMHGWRDDGGSGLAKIPAGERRTNYYWAAFTAPPSDSLQTALAALGASILSCASTYGDGIVYKIDVNGRFNDVVPLLRADPSFINLAAVAVEDKIDEKLWSGEPLPCADSATGALRAMVATYHRVSRAAFESYAAGHVETVEDGDSISKYFTVVATPAQLRDLAFIDEVEVIFAAPPKQPLSFYSRELTGVNQLQAGFVVPVTAPSTGWLSGVQYTGDSIWLCMNEPGANRHLDFCELLGRDTVLRTPGPLIKRRDAAAARWGLDAHGTNMAGIAAGNGWGSAYDPLYGRDSLHWRGVAPKALIIPDFTNGGDINNHSFTEGSEGYYNGYSQYNDYLTSNHANNVEADFDNVSVYAAANNGYFRWYGTQVGYYALLANAKNTILVGATEKGRAVLAGFSSLGPTRDGRIKPDIMAPGAGLLDAGWHIEIDSIALVNGAVKHDWRFGAGDPGWGSLSPDGAGQYAISNLAISGGTMNFDVTAGSYFYSNSFYPQSTVISSVSDTLVIRWQATALASTTPSLMRIQVYWKRPSDADVKDADLTASANITGSWQVVRIPLGSAANLDYNGGWTTGDTLQRIRLGFTHLEGDVVSCYLDDSYAGPGWHGTSEASAQVSGIVALMLQKYRNDVIVPRNAARGTNLNIHDNPPWNSTIRAMLVHTATDMVDTVGISVGTISPDFAASGNPRAPLYGVGPDWATGYGLVNAVKALDVVDTLRFREDTIRQGQSKIWYCTVPAGTARLRATLCWDDPYAANVALADAMHRKLVNNLDLTVKNTSTGVTSLPWTIADSWMHKATIPDSGLDSLITPQGILTHPAVRGVDTSNNLEVVDIDQPAAGTYQITVQGTSVTMKQSTKAGTYQDYSVVCDFPLRTTLTKIAARVAPTVAPAASLPPLQQPVTLPGELGKLSSEPAAGAAGVSTTGVEAADALAAGDPFPQWRYTAVITVNTSAPGLAVTEPVASFPLPVLLTNKNFSFSQTRPDGSDLRFCDADGMPLSYWIESWSVVDRTARIWVLVPNIAANCRTNQIVMYWGNDRASRASDRNAVFSSSAGFAAFLYNASAPVGGRKQLTVASVNAMATSMSANGRKQFCLSWRTAHDNRMAIVVDRDRLTYYRNGDPTANRADLFDKSDGVDDVVVSSSLRSGAWVRLLQNCMGDGQRIVEIR